MADAYTAFASVVRAVDEERSWLPTACTGWSVRELVLHCQWDAQRGLVALHTPADGSPDRDRVSYWQGWGSDPVGSANGRRFTRVMASMFLHASDLCALYLETAAAAVAAAARADADAGVRTQGHVLRAGELMHTLAVEATIHHLDVLECWPDAQPPAASGLAATREVLDGLLGRPVPLPWDDAHYARAATGRTPLTNEERDVLGADAERFPLFC